MFRTQLGQSNGFLSLKIREFIDRSSAYNITGTKGDLIKDNDAAQDGARDINANSVTATKGGKNGK
jgi:flagellar motor switch protein FliM